MLLNGLNKTSCQFQAANNLNKQKSFLELPKSKRNNEMFDPIRIDLMDNSFFSSLR